MEPISIEKTETTPEVIFDNLKDYYKISGESRPENAREFYGNLMNWLDDFKNTLFYIFNETKKPKNLELNLEFVYLNSSSIKFLYDLLKSLESFKPFCNVSINWHYDPKDIEMEENGLEYAKMVNLKFNQIAK